MDRRGLKNISINVICSFLPIRRKQGWCHGQYRKPFVTGRHVFVCVSVCVCVYAPKLGWLTVTIWSLQIPADISGNMSDHFSSWFSVSANPQTCAQRKFSPRLIALTWKISTIAFHFLFYVDDNKMRAKIRAECAPRLWKYAATKKKKNFKKWSCLKWLRKSASTIISQIVR